MKYKLLDYHGESRDYMHLVIKVQIFQQIESSGILVSRCEIEDKSQLFSTLFTSISGKEWMTGKRLFDYIRKQTLPDGTTFV